MQLQPFLASVGKVVIEAQTASIDWGNSAVEWHANIQARQEAFIYLADCGWTAPDWISMSDLMEMKEWSAEDIEKYCVEGFMENDAANLKALGETLLANSDFEQWHPLIAEAVVDIAEGAASRHHPRAADDH